MTNEEAIYELETNVDYKTPAIKEACQMAIKALEQQPCDDWYDVPSYEMTLEQARQAVKDLRKKLAEKDINVTTTDVISRKDMLAVLSQSHSLTQAWNGFEKLPSVTLKEKTGKWIDEEVGFDGDIAYRCSNCNELFWVEEGTPKDNEYNYCPNCGARMVEQQEKSEYEHDHEVVKAYNDGQAYILDKIRAEVELLGKDYLGCPQPQVVCDDVIKIIDKYRGDTDGNS